ncbi:MAG: hypothetical protein HN961_06715, partial [Planctomycetes bacterium]|nr:hypothetical protein [Planctomycetota bacterium]
MVKVIPFILSFILYGSASAQEHIELSIGDSWLQTPIADVQVVELNSGAIGFSNAQGIVEFSTPFAPNVDMQFEVSSAAYPTHFFERLVFDSACSNLTHFFLGLAPECDWVSPLFGSSAGTKSIQVATGQSLGQYVGDPNPVEYMQDVSFSIPANAIQAPQRFGLALPARSAWNNYQIDAVSTQPLVMAAQFRITWLDASGIPFVGAPLLFPAQVEMTAGDVLAREALLDGWEFASFTFDESHLSWSQTSPEWGGNMTEAIMSADLHEPGLYAFLLKNPQVEVSAVCQHKWLTKPWVDAPMYTEQLIC